MLNPLIMPHTLIYLRQHTCSCHTHAAATHTGKSDIERPWRIRIRPTNPPTCNNNLNFKKTCRRPCATGWGKWCDWYFGWQWGNDFICESQWECMCTSFLSACYHCRCFRGASHWTSVRIITSLSLRPLCLQSLLLYFCLRHLQCPGTSLLWLTKFPSQYKPLKIPAVLRCRYCIVTERALN